MPKAIDLAGERFGHLTVLSEELPRRDRNRRWVVQCDCGHTYSSVSSTLKKRTADQKCSRCSGKSSGRYEPVAKCPIKRRHNLMMQRCFDEQHYEYKFFGGRGITVWPKWKEFDAFQICLVLFDSDLDFDRINTDGHWEPNNTFLTNWRDVKIALGGFDYDGERQLQLY